MLKISAQNSQAYLFRLKWVAAGLIFCFTALFCGCRPQEIPSPTITPTPKELEMIRDQAYHTDGLKEHKLDIYLPTGNDSPFPTLLMIHGGSGQKMDLAYWGQIFARKGYAAVSIDHRQWPDHNYPVHLEDAFCALAWIHKAAEIYNFDTNNIIVMGHSAGGTLAAMLGVIDDPTPFLKESPQELPKNYRIQGIIPFTGIFDYQSAINESPSLENYATELLGGTPQEVPEIWLEASAASWVDGSEPPFLIIHGQDDQNIPASQSQDFALILETAGVDVELLLIPDADHNQIKSSTQSIEAVENFISRIIE